MIKSPYTLNKNFNKIFKYNNSFLTNIYKKLYLSRYTEEYIKKVYPNNIMKTPTHLGIGQEAVSVGVCSNLKKNDSIFCHHRSHLPFFLRCKPANTNKPNFWLLTAVFMVFFVN